MKLSTEDLISMQNMDAVEKKTMKEKC